MHVYYDTIVADVILIKFLDFNLRNAIKPFKKPVQKIIQHNPR